MLVCHHIFVDGKSITQSNLCTWSIL
uniref:Uncharacterized protein n=1 Tax=Rhizophora mucronata TaxID=61149 RepID=A0A2P2IK46_RHIMU